MVYSDRGFYVVCADMGGMGIGDWFSSADHDDGGEDRAPPANGTRYVIVATAPEGHRHPHPDELEDGEWRFKGEPPTERQFRFDYGELLEEGVQYVCAPQTSNGPDFDDIQWEFTIEQTRSRDQLDEIQREVRDIKDGDGPMPAGFEPTSMEDVMLFRMMDEEGTEAAWQHWQTLEEKREGTASAFLDDADIDNTGQVLRALFMDMAQNYDSVGEAVGDVFGGLMETAEGAARVGPAARRETAAQQQQPQTTEQAQEPSETMPETPAKSPAQERFEDLHSEADDAEEARELDLGADRDGGELREEMESELGVDLDQEDGSAEVEDEHPPDSPAESPPDDTKVDPSGMGAGPVQAEPDGGGEGDTGTETGDTDDGDDAEDVSGVEA